MTEQYDNPHAAAEAKHKRWAEEWRAAEREELRRRAERDVLGRKEEERRTRPTPQGEEIAGELMRHSVATLPIYQLIAGSAMETGHGWHVANIRVFMGVEAEARIARFALSTKGAVLEFISTHTSSLHETHPGYDGIIYPAPLHSEKTIALISNAFFQNGIRSLISTGEPYTDPTIYDY